MGRKRSVEPGQRFGLLTVVGYVPTASGRLAVLTRCDCGRERLLADASHLRGTARVRLECLGHGGPAMRPKLSEVVASRRGGEMAWLMSQADIRARIAAAKNPAQREAWESALGVRGLEGYALRQKLRATYGSTP